MSHLQQKLSVAYISILGNTTSQSRLNIKFRPNTLISRIILDKMWVELYLHKVQKTNLFIAQGAKHSLNATICILTYGLRKEISTLDCALR